MKVSRTPILRKVIGHQIEQAGLAEFCLHGCGLPPHLANHARTGHAFLKILEISLQRSGIDFVSDTGHAISLSHNRRRSGGKQHPGRVSNHRDWFAIRSFKRMNGSNFLPGLNLLTQRNTILVEAGLWGKAIVLPIRGPHPASRG